MKKGLVHDAASAKIAAEINELLRSCDAALTEQRGLAEQGLFGQGHWAQALQWDLTALRARLDRVRELVNGSP